MSESEFDVSLEPTYVSFVTLGTFLNCTPQDWSYRLQPWFSVVSCLLLALVFFFVLLGLILNSLSFLGLQRSGEKTLLNLILQELTTCDQLVLITNAGDCLVHTLEGLPPLTTAQRHLIIYGHPVFWMLRSAAACLRNWTMVVMCLTRVLHILFPLHTRVLQSRRFLAALFAVKWITVLPAYYLKTAETWVVVADCPEAAGGWVVHIRGSQILPGWYIWVTGVISISILPIALCIAANVLLLLRMRLSMRFRAKMAPQSADKGQGDKASKGGNRSAKLVIQLTVLFIVCQGSTALYTYLTMFQESPLLYVLINSVATLVNVIDSSCNFFILFSTNMKMRQALLKTFLCRTLGPCFKKKTVAVEQRSWHGNQRLVANSEFSSQRFYTTHF